MKAAARACLAAASAAMFAAFAQNAFAQTASAEDCAVIAAAGEEKLKWREQSPAMPMYAKSYGAACGWKAMGIKPFAIPALGPGPYFDGVRFGFSRPAYSPDGLEAKLTYTLYGNASPKEYFISLDYCTAKKLDGRWHSTGCKPGPIT